jgi:hypothetical protein
MKRRCLYGACREPARPRPSIRNNQSAAVPKLPDIQESLADRPSVITGLRIAEYLELHTDSRFDGARARLHLEKHLAMRLADADQRDDLLPTFQVWLQGCADTITLHPSGPQFLLPPPWYG